MARKDFMNNTLRVSFESPQSGWMSFGLEAGAESLSTVASHEPYNSLRDLIEVLSAVLSEEADSKQSVRWNCEPDELDFNLTTEDQRTQFSVVHYPDHHRRQDESRVVFSLHGSKLEVCLPFWKALRDLHRRISTDEFTKNWRREFPQREMQRFTKIVRNAKRKLRR